MNLKIQSVLVFVFMSISSLSFANDLRPKINDSIHEKFLVTSQVGGLSFSFASLIGKVSVINFWAIWCEACKKELAEMQEEFKEFLLKPDFNFAFVSIDSEPKEAIDWVKTEMKDGDNWTKYLFHDAEQKNMELLNINKFPTTLLVDRSGKIFFVQEGYDTHSTKLLAEKLRAQWK